MLGKLDKIASVKGRVEDVYEMGHELGKGAFSIVRHGRHRQTGENVALKIIGASRFKSNKRAQEAIRAEVEAMQRIRGRIDSPSLIIMLGVYSDPTKVCIVLEELNGGELFDRIVARGRYTETDASQVLHKLAVALGQCHEEGILHRDVKPENIMYISRAVTSGIKLTDFGLAMLHTGASVTRRDDNLVGTPGYVAPEVLSSRLYGPPCDVWACGVLTYILLAGYPPFYPSGEETLFEVIKQGKYHFHADAWDQISSEGKDLVYKMLTVDVEKRATIDSILKHPWVVQSNQLPQQHLSGTINRLKAFNAKRKWRAVATVVMMGARLGRRKRDRASSGEKAGNHGFSASELDSLEKAFLSSAEGGVLGSAQLASVLSDIGFGPVPFDRMFDLFDADGNGKVDYAEFLQGMSSFKRSGDKALRFCFDIYDRDGTGSINLEQLKAVLSCVMQNQESSSSQEDNDRAAQNVDEKIADMFQKLDADGNGAIDFAEFKAGVQREPLLVEAFLAPVRQGSLAPAPPGSRKSSPQASIDASASTTISMGAAGGGATSIGSAGALSIGSAGRISIESAEAISIGSAAAKSIGAGGAAAAAAALMDEGGATATLPIDAGGAGAASTSNAARAGTSIGGKGGAAPSVTAAGVTSTSVAGPGLTSEAGASSIGSGGATSVDAAGAASTASSAEFSADAAGVASGSLVMAANAGQQRAPFDGPGEKDAGGFHPERAGVGGGGGGAAEEKEEEEGRDGAGKRYRVDSDRGGGR